MVGLIALGASSAAVVALAYLFHRRWREVDSYFYKDEHRDPPVSHLGNYLGGDRL